MRIQIIFDQNYFISSPVNLINQKLNKQRVIFFTSVFGYFDFPSFTLGLNGYKYITCAVSFVFIAFLC